MRNEVIAGLGLAVTPLPRRANEAPTARGAVGAPGRAQLGAAMRNTASLGAGYLTAIAALAEPKKQVADDTGRLAVGGGLEQTSPQIGATPANVRPETKAGSSTVGRGKTRGQDGSFAFLEP
jgi:hypothetical protein